MSEFQTILQSYHYNSVVLPRTGIKPLQMLKQDQKGTVTSLDMNIDDFFKPDIVAKPSTKTEKVISIQDERKVDVNGKVDISFLEQLLAKFGIGSINAHFKSAPNFTIRVGINNIEVDTIGLGTLDRFLSTSILQEKEFGTWGKELKDSNLFVITSVLKSNEINITVESNSSLDTGAAVKLENIIDFNAGYDKTNLKDYSLKHESESEQMVFGIRGVRINYDKPGLFDRSEKVRFTIGKELNNVVMKGVEDIEPIWLDATNWDLTPPVRD